MKSAVLAVIICSLLPIRASQGKGENLALKGRATQSSVLSGEWWREGHLGLAINAIDGNLNPNFARGSCIHTNGETSPWWRVDLLEDFYITEIVITARDYVPERLNGVHILVGSSLINNGNNNQRCATMNHVRAGETILYKCNNMYGRYVNIVATGQKTTLGFCEVQVYGYSAHAG